MNSRHSARIPILLVGVMMAVMLNLGCGVKGQPVPPEDVMYGAPHSGRDEERESDEEPRGDELYFPDK